MKSLCLLGFAFISAHSRAAEVLLYDCDYTDSPDLVGQPIPLSSAPMPGRSACSEIVFGEVRLENAAAPWTGTTAMMRPLLTPNGVFHYSQMQWVMLSGSVYAFSKHRIETVFRFPSTAATDALTIFTYGGVTEYLSFGSSGQVGLSTNVMEVGGYWGDRVVSQYRALDPIDTSQPVHLIWETDINGGSTTVTINGNSTTVAGLSPQPTGVRNWQLYPGPLFVRFNYSSNGTSRHLALRSVKITGDDYDGPLFVPPDMGVTENDVATAPFVPPTSGTWQPQFSLDGQIWKNYGQPVGADFPFSSISFGKRVSPNMFFRLSRVEN